jgi:hypothetical protein
MPNRDRKSSRKAEPARGSPLTRFLLHFHNILIYVLLGAATITAALGHLDPVGNYLQQNLTIKPVLAT